nr:immunoglobulin heavy chain junction region [Macaca mulatta]MOY18127.1 immunoglobulin heavy chain junction region [Macaca mulatta]MOY18412.1 immunoglobulin heavy chain junction region [Macaca mulatta]MOY18421.1 immunoglobulin heavy chain junction region [Macaca mulatta]MOY18666.1 immunoglobulin heavy chain junction region [Macaca mulatta]
SVRDGYGMGLDVW